MSQSRLANAVGLSPSDISRIECGYRDLSPKEAAAIAAALGLVPVSRSASVPVAANAAAQSTSESPAISTPPPVAVAPFAPVPIVGSNLDDPVNFTELPDLGLLERAALSPAVHRERLLAALARTTKVLHTSRVRAAIWREWRQFERKIHALLQVG